MMESSLFVLGVLSLAIAAATFAAFALGDRKIVRLRDEPLPPEDWRAPTLSIVVTARNEERDLEAALDTLLSVDYPELELLVVNDRSTDQTGAILDRRAAENPRLTVAHLESLPAGWIGKNYAMQFGAERTRGEFVLFTDADILFQPTTLRRAVYYAQQHEIDHLAMTPEVQVPGFWLKSFVATFTIFFCAYFKPWNAKNPDSKAYVGIGAFNLLRRSVYLTVGGHQPIAMRPDDDVKLGKLVKMNGFRQELVAGLDLIAVPWYGSVREAIVGLEKNAFAGADYRLDVILGASLMMAVFNVGPFVAVFLTAGWTRLLFAATALLWLVCGWNSSRNLKQSGVYGLGFPISVLLFLFIQWRSTILTFVNNGIYWRGTHYRLDELRANTVSEPTGES